MEPQHPASPAQWARDPFGRHELRYWDGSRWTDHVADAGIPGADPVEVALETWTPVTEPQQAVTGSTTPAATGGDVDGWAAIESPADRTPTPAVPTPAAAGSPIAPYPSPPAGSRDAIAAWAAPPTFWRSVTGLRTALVVLLSCCGVAALGLIAALANRLVVIDDLQNGRFSFDLVQRADDADDFVGVTAFLLVALVIATAVVWIIWQWRLAKNAEVMGRTFPRFKPGWSIGAWFIPLANLVLPILIMQDLWRASAPQSHAGPEWRREKGSALLGWWWGVYLVSGLTTQFGGGDDKERDLDAIQATNSVALVGAFVLIAAVVLAILVVVRLTRRFDDRRADAGRVA